jgi:Secretory lipase
MSVRSRALGGLVRSVLLALAACMCAPAAHAANTITLFGAPGYEYDAFYVPPSPLPAGKPGDIIRAERMDFSRAITKPPTGTVGWRVMYLSTSALGDRIAVTGTVLVRPNQAPAQGIANRPIVSYGNETQGLADNCAVSRLMIYGHTGELALIEPLIRAGYAVVSTDYEGLGTPAVHTLGVTISAAHAMLDMIRAARNLSEAKLPKAGPLGLFGYSQGGGGGLGAGELASSYAPDLKITAAALGGAPIDLAVVAKNIDGGPAAAMKFLAMTGVDAAYPELRLYDEFLNPLGKALRPAVYGSCIEIIPALAFQWYGNYVVKDPLRDPRWQARMAQNRLGQQRIPFPTYYFHAMLDEVMPYSMATALRNRYCAKGTRLRFAPLVGFEHISAGPQWMPQAAKWLAARLEGRPDGGNCGWPALPNSI